MSGGLAELGDRLGPILWQFKHLRPFDADDFSAFLDLLPDTRDGRRLQHVLEVRDPSFLCPAYLDLMRTHRRASVYTDSMKYPSFADITGDLIYARLMCSQAGLDTGYPEAALDAWAARTRLWLAGKAPEDLTYVQPEMQAEVVPRPSFVYFISSAKERNPAAALALQRRLQSR